MLVGVWIAFALVFPNITGYVAWLTFNRLRTFAYQWSNLWFTLSFVFATWYYVSQRLLKIKIVFEKLAWFHFILYNLIIILAVVSLPLGISSSKEYAELQWPIDILVVVMWY